MLLTHPAPACCHQPGLSNSSSTMSWGGQDPFPSTSVLGDPLAWADLEPTDALSDYFGGTVLSHIDHPLDQGGGLYPMDLGCPSLLASSGHSSLSAVFLPGGGHLPEPPCKLGSCSLGPCDSKGGCDCAHVPLSSTSLLGAPFPALLCPALSACIRNESTSMGPTCPPLHLARGAGTAPHAWPPVPRHPPLPTITSIMAQHAALPGWWVPEGMEHQGWDRG